MAIIQYTEKGNIHIGSTLEEVHEHIKNKLKAKTLKQNALELQNILQQIKWQAKEFKLSQSVASNALTNQYDALIQEATRVHSAFRGKTLKETALFRRSHDSMKTTSKIAQDIFEEELASVLRAGQNLLTNQIGNDIEQFLSGASSSTTKAAIDVSESAQNILKKMAEKEQVDVSTNIRAATAKIDVHGNNIKLNCVINDMPDIYRLMELMKDATFSAKNYTSWNKETLNSVNIHLGNSNIYKAITGALSEVQLGHKQQEELFYHGMNILYKGTTSQKNTNVDSIRQHFNHLRFIYELRGSGLLDDNGHKTYVKYLIYNDPNSANIFVKDTASIILEAFENSRRGMGSIFGDIGISASVFM